MRNLAMIDMVVWVIVAIVFFTFGGNISKDWQQQYFLPIMEKQNKTIQQQKETIKMLKIELLKTKNTLGKRSSLPSRHSNFSFNRGSSFLATAYTHTGNNTASGEYPEADKTIAVDPRIIPLGSKVRISCESLPDYDGIYTAQDTGRGIKGKRIDVFTNTRSEAINFGKRHILVEVLK